MKTLNENLDFPLGNFMGYQSKKVCEQNVNSTLILNKQEKFATESHSF